MSPKSFKAIHRLTLALHEKNASPLIHLNEVTQWMQQWYHCRRPKQETGKVLLWPMQYLADYSVTWMLNFHCSRNSIQRRKRDLVGQNIASIKKSFLSLGSKTWLSLGKDCLLCLKEASVCCVKFTCCIDPTIHTDFLSVRFCSAITTFTFAPDRPQS